MEASEYELMFDSDNAAPQLFSYKELNDFVQDLSATNTCSELLASRLKEKKFAL